MLSFFRNLFSNRRNRSLSLVVPAPSHGSSSTNAPENPPDSIGFTDSPGSAETTERRSEEQYRMEKTALSNLSNVAETSNSSNASREAWEHTAEDTNDQRAAQWTQRRPDLYQSESEIYDNCLSSIIQMLTNEARRKLIAELDGDEAQSMVDFFSEVLDQQNSLLPRARKQILHLLTKLAKSAQVFPQSLELQNVQCDLSKHLTGGGYGLIYKGQHENKAICVKAIHIPVDGAIDRGKMRAHSGELILWAYILHANVLPFVGIYLSEETVPRVCIVSPWMENGDLLHYMKAFPDARPIPLVHDIISGLKYLHDFEIVHGDLKAKNVLISQANRAMLADFGVSRIMTTAMTTTAQVATGTAYWMAPELFMDAVSTPSYPSDIWSFACTCYEIITGMTPFYQFKSVPQLIGAFLRGIHTPLKPSTEDRWNDTKEKIWLVAERCWKSDPESRPTAEELEKLFAGLNTPDYRLPEPEYRRTKTSSKVDHRRVFHILNQISNSQNTPVDLKERVGSQGPERPLQKLTDRATLDESGNGVKEIGTLIQESNLSVKKTDRKFPAMIKTDDMLGRGVHSKFVLEGAFLNPETGVEEVWSLNVNSDVALPSFYSVGARHDPPERQLVGVYQTEDQLAGFDRINGSIGNGKIYIHTQRNVVIRGDIIGGPRGGQSFIGAGTWTRA